MSNYKINIVKHYYDKSRFEFLHGMDNRISTKKFFNHFHEFCLIADEKEVIELKKYMEQKSKIS
jgi:hypothetical protein